MMGAENKNVSGKLTCSSVYRGQESNLSIVRNPSNNSLEWSLINNNNPDTFICNLNDIFSKV